MYLSKIRLINYRRFKDVEVDFSKITLLLGPNSSGKTAIFNGLLSAVQTDKFPLYLNPNGMLAETGDFSEISNKHNKNNKVEISLEYSGSASDGYPLTVTGSFVFDNKTKMPILSSASIKGGVLDVDVSRSRSQYKVHWNYKKEYDDTFKVGEAMPEFMILMKKIHQNSVDSITRKKKMKLHSSEPASGDSGDFTTSLEGFFSPENMGSPWFSVALTKALSTSSSFRSRLVYLGSHRSAPMRTYFNVVGGGLKVGTQGQNAVEQVIEWGIRDQKKLSLLTGIMSEVGLATHMNPYQLSGGRVELRVKTTSRGASASITDVGFGVNQFLPIAVAEIQMVRKGTIAVSQPETHLHPSAQAQVAEHFVRNVKDKGFRYIIESHSEYMVNRIRRLISRGDIDSTDVAPYYVLPGKDGTSKLIRMNFKRDGVIEGAPKEFFETYQLDVFGIAMRE